MALDRTWYNTLVDETAPGTGTPIDKLFIDALLDSVDASLATIQTTTSTGTQNNFTVTATSRLVLRCNNASLLTITGFTAGGDGDIIDIVSVGAGQVDLTHQDAGSTAGLRLINYATVGKTSLAAGSGTARYVYDATTARWRLVRHEQGAWISPAYSAGNFVSSGGTWTVDSGDMTTYAYRLSGRTLTFTTRIDTSSTTGSPSNLNVTIPAGLVSAKSVQDAAVVFDNSSTISDMGVAFAAPAATVVSVFLKTFAAFANTTNLTYLRFTLSLEVQ